jgi:Trypsin-co-occurring domain 1
VSIYADVPLADGGWFTVEVDDGRQRSAEADRRALEQALARAVGVVLTRLRGAAERPNQIEVEFGVKLSTSWLRSSRAPVARPASGSPSAGIASEAVA